MVIRFTSEILTTPKLIIIVPNIIKAVVILVSEEDLKIHLTDKYYPRYPGFGGADLTPRAWRDSCIVSSFSPSQNEIYILKYSESDLCSAQLSLGKLNRFSLKWKCSRSWHDM